MRVLVITPVGKYVGGAERSGYLSVRGMVDAGWHVHAISSGPGDFVEDLKDLGVPVTLTGGKHIVLGKKTLSQRR